jgi:uncharacterized protein (DUF1330 family)
MTAYVISEVEVLDESAADRYRELAQRSIEQHGGRYVVRGALPDAVEGTWEPERRLVIVAFPDLEAARTWYDSRSTPKHSNSGHTPCGAACSWPTVFPWPRTALFHVEHVRPRWLACPVFHVEHRRSLRLRRFGSRRRTRREAPQRPVVVVLAVPLGLCRRLVPACTWSSPRSHRFFAERPGSVRSVVPRGTPVAGRPPVEPGLGQTSTWLGRI